MTNTAISVDKVQVISGTEAMVVPDQAPHVRAVQFSVPRFESRPDILVTISSPEDATRDLHPQFAGNPGAVFGPSSIEYSPAAAGDGGDLITVNAVNTVEGVGNNYLYLCSYLVVGKKPEL
jgi:hypothetical protein